MEKAIEIPEGYEARIEGNKVILEPKENEDERIRKALLNEFIHLQSKGYKFAGLEGEEIVSWLEKKSTPQVRTGIEWENTIDDACAKIYSVYYNHSEDCHEQSFKWGFQEGVEWLEEQGSQNLANSAKTCKDEQKPADIERLLQAEYKKGWDKALLQLPKEVDSQIWQIANNSAKTWDESFAILCATQKAYDKGRKDALKEQNPAWSEEDEKILGKCIDAASGYYSPEDKQSMKDWLRAIKDRVHLESE